MRSITYRCGCVNAVQPNTSLRSVSKCAEHTLAQNPNPGFEYYKEFGVIDEQERLILSPHADQLLEALGPISFAASANQALEIGAGCSPYFAMLVRLGYKYTACDESEYACRVMRSHGANVIQSAFESAEIKRYDLILAAHVLEHVVDPAAVLRKIATHLRPRWGR